MERRLTEIVQAEDEGLALGNFLRRRMGLSKKEISRRNSGRMESAWTEGGRR